MTHVAFVFVEFETVGSHRHHWTPCPWVCVFEAEVGVHIDEKVNDDGMHMCPHILHGASRNGLLLRAHGP
jgi:hypothetical protein